MIFPYAVFFIFTQISSSTDIKIDENSSIDIHTDQTLSGFKVTKALTCNKQYIIATEKVNFNDAVLLCLQYGMEIASPINAAEEAALVKELNGETSQTVKETTPPGPLQTNQGIFAQFIKWCLNKGIRDFTSENTLVSYFEELTKTEKPSVIKEIYLFLKNALLITTGIDISKYSGMNKVLTQNEVYNFNDGIWIGSTRCPSCAKQFIWINTGFPVDYSNFLKNEQGNDTNSDNCLGLVYENQNKFGWHTYQCETKLVYACQTRCCRN